MNKYLPLTFFKL